MNLFYLDVTILVRGYAGDKQFNLGFPRTILIDVSFDDTSKGFVTDAKQQVTQLIQTIKHLANDALRTGSADHLSLLQKHAPPYHQ